MLSKLLHNYYTNLILIVLCKISFFLAFDYITLFNGFKIGKLSVIGTLLSREKQ